jgi:hypothetical protein
VATTDSKPPVPGGDPKRCKFANVLGCSGLHPSWRCGAFGSIRPEERARIIKDNRMCSFCLLHGEAEACRAKANKSKPACDAPECGGQHALWLHELLKGTAGQEGQVNMVQGGDGWKTLEEAWMEDEREAEEQVLFVNVMQAETMDSEEELADEIERMQVAVDECYCRRAKRAGLDIRNTEGRLLSEEELDDLSERLGDGEGTRAKRRREIERMSIKELEAKIKEVRSLTRREAKKVGCLPLTLTILCLVGGPAKGFIAYDCSNRSDIVESYSLLEPDVCANMGKEGLLGTTVYGEIVQIKQDRIISVIRCVVIESIVTQYCGHFS